MTLLLGIDLGTSSVKTIVFDADNNTLVGMGSAEYPILHPHPGYAEQSPAAWWQAAVLAVRQALAASGRREISAISFSGQMHGTVLIDAHGSPVHPAIIWADQRATFADITAMVDAADGADAYHPISGTMPCLGFMGVTLYWLARHAPEVFAAAHRVLLPKDYLRFRLTGAVGTDVSDAASTGIFDIHRRDWRWDVLERWGIPAALFPPVAGSSAVAGFLTREAAEAFGIAPGVPVVYGAADQAAQAVGSGVIASGQMSVTVGSGGQVFAPACPGLGERVLTDARLMVFNHAVPDTYYAEGAILSAGLSLRWLRGIVGLDNAPAAYEILSLEATAISPGSDGLHFIPTLIPERNPWADQAAPPGGFSGLKLHHTRGYLARAVMEGIALATREQVNLIRAIAPTLHTVIVSGGAMTSPVWRGILADVLDLPLTQTTLTDQAALGAAMIAGVGIGYWKTFDEACAHVVRGDTSLTEPDAARAAFYRSL